MVQISDWISHKLGDPMPVNGETQVIVMQDNGGGEVWQDDGPSKAAFWDSYDPENSNWATTETGSCNIIAYRVVKP